MQPIEGPGGLMIDASLRSWKGNVDRIGKFFGALSPEQLQQEIAPGRNRLIYVWGHIAAVNERVGESSNLLPIVVRTEIKTLAKPRSTENFRRK